MEKSWNCDPKSATGSKTAPKNELSRKALSLSPQGVPMQLAPLVVESNDR